MYFFTLIKAICSLCHCALSIGVYLAWKPPSTTCWLPNTLSMVVDFSFLGPLPIGTYLHWMWQSQKLCHFRNTLTSSTGHNNLAFFKVIQIFLFIHNCGIQQNKIVAYPLTYLWTGHVKIWGSCCHSCYMSLIIMLFWTLVYKDKSKTFKDILVMWGTIQEFWLLLLRSWRGLITLDCKMLRSLDILQVLLSRFACVAWSTTSEFMVLSLPDLSKFL